MKKYDEIQLQKALSARRPLLSRYKYVGIVLDEMLDYSVTANVLADSGGRALGSLYTKFRNNKGFGYTTYTKMFDSCVSPMLDYCSGVWGYNKLEKLDTVQNRAIRLFLGVHRFTPNKAIKGDMGWIPSRIRRHVNILRLWNRLIGLSSDRLTRKIFDYDKSCGQWCKSVRKILLSIDCNDYHDNHVTVDLYNAKGLLFEVQCDERKIDVHKFPKLRTYLLFKQVFYTEPYVTNIYNRDHRSALAQLRCVNGPAFEYRNGSFSGNTAWITIMHVLFLACYRRWRSFPTLLFIL